MPAGTQERTIRNDGKIIILHEKEQFISRLITSCQREIPSLLRFEPKLHSGLKGAKLPLGFASSSADVSIRIFTPSASRSVILFDMLLEAL
ncbi:hypothetical protein ACVW1A_002750 [Bradyrhizobium sp. LB1.3]